MLYIEENCTIQHQGRKFTAGGAVVSPERVTAYIKTNGAPHADSVGACLTITDWHGNTLGQGYITAKWRINSWMSSHMFQVQASIDGVTYTGRTCGNGMIWKGRKVK